MIVCHSQWAARHQLMPVAACQVGLAASLLVPCPPPAEEEEHLLVVPRTDSILFAPANNDPQSNSDMSTAPGTFSRDPSHPSVYTHSAIKGDATCRQRGVDVHQLLSNRSIHISQLTATNDPMEHLLNRSPHDTSRHVHFSLDMMLFPGWTFGASQIHDRTRLLASAQVPSNAAAAWTSNSDTATTASLTSL